MKRGDLEAASPTFRCSGWRPRPACPLAAGPVPNVALCTSRTSKDQIHNHPIASPGAAASGLNAFLRSAKTSTASFRRDPASSDAATSSISEGEREHGRERGRTKATRQPNHPDCHRAVAERRCRSSCRRGQHVPKASWVAAKSATRRRRPRPPRQATRASPRRPEPGRHSRPRPERPEHLRGPRGRTRSSRRRRPPPRQPIARAGIARRSRRRGGSPRPATTRPRRGESDDRAAAASAMRRIAALVGTDATIRSGATHAPATLGTARSITDSPSAVPNSGKPASANPRSRAAESVRRLPARARDPACRRSRSSAALIAPSATA